MQGYIFRMYDIRGIVGTELIIDHVYRLGCAIAAYYTACQPALRTVVVGMDGRSHSPLIKDELIRALCDSGLEVIFIGICPTPVVYFALHTKVGEAGLMITASHNGPDYNGIKICLGTESVWGDQINVIRTLYEQEEKCAPRPHGTVHYVNVQDRYIDWLVEHFSHLIGLDFPLVIDCANGATGAVLPQLIDRLAWKQCRLLYETIDGLFPHHEADPTIDENMEDLRGVMKTYGAQLGIGFDGDGDRMAPLTHEGELVSGDKLLLLFAQPLLQKQKGTIVFDIKCSRIVAELVTNWGGKPSLVPSGHSIIKHAMHKEQAVLGGELSCHFFFADRYFGYDDGIYAALRLVELLVTSSLSLQQQVQQLPTTYATPELRFACAEEAKFVIVEHAKNFFATRTDAQLLTIDGIRATLPYGWGLLRASNTQAFISIRCESSTSVGLAQVKHDFYQLLVPYLEKKLLHSLLGE